MAKGQLQNVGEALAQAKEERDETKTAEGEKAGYFGANCRSANRYSVGRSWHHV